MFSFDNGPDIETVSNEPEFLADIVNICDNGRALVHDIRIRAVASQWVHYRVDESCGYSLIIRATVLYPFVNYLQNLPRITPFTLLFLIDATK
jgi:hypothetical protein